MKLLQKSYSLRNNISLVTLLLLSQRINSQGVANYVNNPSFENVIITNSLMPYQGVRNWSAIDTTKGAFAIFSENSPYFNVPYASYGFQYPKSGGNFIISTFYRNVPGAIWYPKNRLKQTLKSNTVYCAKYHVVNTNNNRIAIDSYGMHFGGTSLDTISYCTIPLIYLAPQIQSTLGIITDTLHWIPVSGTFTAVGDEKYLVLGNFNNPTNTNTLLINTPTLSFMTNDVYVDDVSLIEMELPAYSGSDKWIAPGDSAYIGRESDVEIDESCIWYRMTSPTTSIVIDTIAGMWVKPVVTTTYVVRQQLWCSGIKWDTVVVSMSGVGITELESLQNNIHLFPVPAQNELRIQLTTVLENNFISVSICNNLGQLIREEEITFKSKTASVKTDDLPNGIYFLQLKNNKSETLSKRFVISR